MKGIMAKRPSPAMVVAVISLFVALSGASYAALRTDSVGSKQIKQGAVKSPEVKNDGITGQDVREQTLQGVPVAETAESAFDAERLDGIESTGFLRSNAAAGGDLSGNYPSPSIAANGVDSGDVADNSLTGADIDESSLGTLPDADEVAGLTLRKVNFRRTVFTQLTEVLNVNGLQLIAACSGGTLATGVIARTSKNDSHLQSASLDSNTAQDPNNLVRDTNFDTGEDKALLAEDPVGQIGQTSYWAPDGSVVTVNWQADSIDSCWFSGTAVSG